MARKFKIKTSLGVGQVSDSSHCLEDYKAWQKKLAEFDSPSITQCGENLYEGALKFTFCKNELNLKHDLNVYFTLSRKSLDNGFLPLSTFPVSVKNGHLNERAGYV